LKVLNGSHQGSVVSGSRGGDLSDRRHISQQAQQPREPWNAGVCAAGEDWLNHRRQLLSVVFSRKSSIGLKSFERTAVARIWRLHLCQDSADIGCAHNTIFEKIGKIVFLRLLVESEVQMLRIHLSDVDVGDIPHRTDRELNIKVHGIRINRLSRCRLEARQPFAPARPVIIFGREALLVGIKQQRDQLPWPVGWAPNS
jgi:hypothetical protein